jgi:hypothetical protein
MSHGKEEVAGMEKEVETPEGKGALRKIWVTESIKETKSEY